VYVVDVFDVEQVRADGGKVDAVGSGFHLSRRRPRRLIKPNLSAGSPPR
jgi:hypothetical protein